MQTPTNLAHIPASYFSDITFNIILRSTPTSLKWSLPFRISDQILYPFHSVTRPTRFIPIDLFTLILFVEKILIMKLLSAQNLSLHPPLRSPFSNTLNLCSYFGARDQRHVGLTPGFETRRALPSCPQYVRKLWWLETLSFFFLKFLLNCIIPIRFSVASAPLSCYNAQ
jgi:hypothetical protein